ncbi:major facilitator superfamily transporter [Seiridium cupressi]
MDLKDLTDSSHEQPFDRSDGVHEIVESAANYDPRSWPFRRKWLIMSLVSWLCLVSPLASSMFAPATSLMNDEFHNKDATLTTFTVSFFILGYVVGSLITAPLSEQFGRKVIYWLLFILGSLTLILQVLVNRETNLRVIRARRRAFEGRPQRWWHRLDWYATVDISDEDGRGEFNLAQSMLRPWKFIFTSPITGLLCLYSGFVYGLLYLLLTTITNVFVLNYHWSIGESGLSYIGIGVGFLLGVVIIGGTSDRMMAKHTKLNNNIPIPEVRLRICVYVSFLIPISFWWYGWSADQQAFWLAPIIGLVCFGLGMIGILLPVQTYMIDAFPDYAASSTAALASSRNVVGTFLPLAGPYLYKAIGLGWGNTLLGFIALILIPAPYFIAKYGGKLRMEYPIKI